MFCRGKKNQHLEMLKFWHPCCNWQCSRGETKLKNNILFSGKKKGGERNRSHRTPFPSVTKEVCVPPLAPWYPPFSYMTGVLMQSLCLSASGLRGHAGPCFWAESVGRDSTLLTPNGRLSRCTLHHLPEASEEPTPNHPERSTAHSFPL